jgi:hypothetical protein
MWTYTFLGLPISLSFSGDSQETPMASERGMERIEKKDGLARSDWRNFFGVKVVGMGIVGG